MKQAKRFLIEHSTKIRIIAARIFEINVKTLIAFINRDFNEIKEEQNKKLNRHEERAIENFIRSLLTHEISSTYQIVFNAIIDLKRARDATDSTKR
jgi:hypothetical protein